MVTAEENAENNASDQFRKLFVGGLSAATSDESLKAFYSQWGEIVDCVVMRDPATKRTRGFGFVTFSNDSELDAAMAARPHVIDDKTVDPKRAVPRDQSQRVEPGVSSKRLYVSGVRPEHSEDSLRDYFSQFGNIEKVDIILDKVTGSPRGFAFVTFDDYDAVDKCVLLRSHQICNQRCDVKRALSKEEMMRSRDRMDRMDRSRGMGRGGGYSRGGSYGGSPYGSQRGYGNGGGYSRYGSTSGRSWNTGSSQYGASSGYGSTEYGGAGSYGSGASGGASWGESGDGAAAWSGSQAWPASQQTGSGGWGMSTAQEWNPGMQQMWGGPQAGQSYNGRAY